MKTIIQGVMAAALVCGAALVMSCSSKDGEKTVFLDDYEKNIANKIVGKWINVEDAGKTVPTNMKNVLTFENFTKGYFSTTFGDAAWINREPFEIKFKRDTLSWIIPNDPALIHVEHVVNSVNETEMNTTARIVAKVGDQIIDEVGPMTMRLVKVPHDYRTDIVGLWEGKVTSDSSKFDDGELHRWEYREDGSYVYYSLVDGSWIAVDQPLNQYYVDGTLLFHRWKNGEESQENREWWEIESIENGVMKWTALRLGEDGAPYTASFSMTKVTEP